MYRFFFFLLVATGLPLLSSCNDDKKDAHKKTTTYENDILHPDDFRFGGKLQAERILPHEENFGAVATVGDYLVISKQFADPQAMFTAYDTDLNQIATFGKVGNGPGEFSINLVLINSVYCSGKNECTYLNIDHAKLRYMLIDLTNSIKTGETQVIESGNIPNKLMGAFFSDKVFLKSGYIYGQYYDQMFKLLDEQTGVFVSNISTGSLRTYPIFNLQMDSDRPDHIASLNARHTRFNPNTNLMVSVPVYTPMIDFYEFSSDSVLFNYRKYFGDNSVDSTVNANDFKARNLTRYFGYLHSTHRYIYMIYHHNGSDVVLGESESSILVMDWSGNPVCGYGIPSDIKIDIYNVSYDDRMLYGVDYSLDQVFRFNINPERCSL